MDIDNAGLATTTTTATGNDSSNSDNDEHIATANMMEGLSEIHNSNINNSSSNGDNINSHAPHRWQWSDSLSPHCAPQILVTR